MNQPLVTDSEILDLLKQLQSQKNNISPIHENAFRRQGDNYSVFRGSGMDYEESRYYQPGDDPRYMNWQLSARTGQYYMKVFREERQPGVFILVDKRKTMCFGTQQRLKVTQAARLATVAALNAIENNHSVSGVILSDTLQWFRESQSKQSVFDFIHQVASPVKPVFRQSGKDQELAGVLRILNELLVPGTIIYLLSDFYDINKDSQPILLQLSSLHTMQALQVSDPAEHNIPEAGVLSLQTVDSSNSTTIDTQKKKERDRYSKAANRYFSDARNLFKNVAADYQQVLTTDTDIISTITGRL